MLCSQHQQCAQRQLVWAQKKGIAMTYSDGKKRVEMTIDIIIIYFIFHRRSVGLTINLLNLYKIWMCRKMSQLYKHTVARLKLYEFVSIEVRKP